MSLDEADELFEKSALQVTSINGSSHGAAEGNTDEDNVNIIVVSAGGKTQQVCRLTKDTITIGRADNCDIHLDDSSVSRLHARLTRLEHGFEIEDSGSTNGVFVNRERVERASLQHGDVISISGRFHLKFL